MEMWEKFMKLVKGSRYCVLLRSAQNSLLIRVGERLLESKCSTDNFQISPSEQGGPYQASVAHVNSCNGRNMLHLWRLFSILSSNSAPYAVTFFQPLQSDSCGMLPNTALCARTGLTSAQGELCTKAAPPHQGPDPHHCLQCSCPSSAQHWMWVPAFPSPLCLRTNRVWSSCPSHSCSPAVAPSWEKMM